MSTQADIAFSHRDDVTRISHQAQQQVAGMWTSAAVVNLDSAWDALAPHMVATVTAAQTAAARKSKTYMQQMDDAGGVSNPSGLDVAPEAFAGIMLDGREVGPAMYTAVTTTKTLIGQGVSNFDAFQRGSAALMTIVSSSVRDIGRIADETAGAARTYTYYVRVCNGSACSRCAILAGMRSGKNAFLRHPSCQCGTAPVTETIHASGKLDVDNSMIPGGLYTSPEELFESMTPEQQERTFTVAGAKAIRAGANPIKVVNARRGAYGITYNGHYNIPIPKGQLRRLQPITIGKRADGSPLQVYATRESTTIRGVYGRRQYRAGQEVAKGEGDRYRRTTRLRLMPEQIQIMAGNDPHEYVRLLQRYGYLDEPVARRYGVADVR